PMTVSEWAAPTVVAWASPTEIVWAAPTVTVWASPTVVVWASLTVSACVLLTVTDSAPPTVRVRLPVTSIVSSLATASFRTPLIVIVSLFPTVSVRSFLMWVVSLLSTVFFRSRPIQCVSSFLPWMSWFFWAWIQICSLPAESSSRMAFAPPPPGELLENRPDWVLAPGRPHGGIWSALYTLPTTIGWSASPSRKLTITSWPIRGMLIPPNPLPAESGPTPIQHDLSASNFPCRSQWNWTLIRPYLSVKISSPAGPTTVAVCDPRTIGRGVTRGGRNGRAAGRHSKRLEYRIGAPVDWYESKIAS